MTTARHFRMLNSPSTGRAGRLPSPHHNNRNQGADMGEQRREKMVKKPKKDTAPPKTGTPSDRPQAPMTSVLPKGKMKNKQ
jgi:hypothetical protein